MAEIRLGGKLGGVALVDDEDYERVIGAGHWYQHHSGFAATMIRQLDGSRKFTVLNRLVLHAPEGTQVRFRNLDRLDCRKANLIYAHELPWLYTKAEGYRGVCLHATGHWQAYLMVQHETVVLGYYSSTEKAAKAVDAYARVFYPNHPVPNFPDEAPWSLIEARANVARRERGYWGVHWHKRAQAWLAQRGSDYLGLYSTQEEAARVVDLARRAAGRNERLSRFNFPELGLLVPSEAARLLEAAREQRLRRYQSAA